jgi:hypothetical protein
MILIKFNFVFNCSTVHNLINKIYHFCIWLFNQFRLPSLHTLSDELSNLSSFLWSSETTFLLSSSPQLYLNLQTRLYCFCVLQFWCQFYHLFKSENAEETSSGISMTSLEKGSSIERDLRPRTIVIRFRSYFPSISTMRSSLGFIYFSN